MVERSLAEEFGVSRTPVREALKLLVAEGLATAGPTRITVAELTLKDVRDVQETAQALHILAAKLAAARGTDDQMRRLEDAMVEMEKIGRAHV